MRPLAGFALAVAGAAVMIAALLRHPAVSAAPTTTAGATVADGFDHLWHEGRVSVGLAAEIPCTRCHAMDANGLLQGRPKHGACFGDCHGPAPAPRRPGRRITIAADQRRFCVICHAPADLDAAEAGVKDALGVAYPPYQRDPDHGLMLSHAAHQGARDAQGKPGDCTTCHAMPGTAGATASQARGHARCTGCHAAPGRASSPAPGPAPGRASSPAPGRAPGQAPTPATGPAAPGTGPAANAPPGSPGSPGPPGPPGSPGPLSPPGPPGMDQCLRCHIRAYGPRTRPYLVRGPAPVSATFSHPSHAARGATDCLTCHDAVARSADLELPAPTMASCQSCHDGNAAFSALGPHCRRCHTAPDAAMELRPRLQARYDHDRHRAHLGDASCARCHTLDARGVPRAPAADHAPCSDAGCHRDQFSALEPTICGACHIGFEPWRPLHFDRPPRASTQFGARFSHRAHLVERGPATGRACQDCHRLASQRRDMRLPRDHSACTGAACHARQGGAAPGLDACQDCHVAGLSDLRERARRQAPWTVRARFRHAPHQRDPGTGAAMACTGCHAGVDQARSIHDVPTPAKQTCVACHDGEHAFKITGHGCARCHGDAASP